MRRTRACCPDVAPSRRRKPRLSERAVDLAADDDPVGAFRAAHDAGAPVLLRTSGSRATPRAVVRTTTSWVESFEHVSALAGLSATSTVWVPGPVTSSMNLFALVHADHAGARVVGSPDEASHAVLTPAALEDWLDTGPGAAGPAGRTVVVAGDRLSPALHERARAAGVEVHHYYGAAELSFVAWGRHADDLHVFPGVEAEARDGEIWVRSPYLCAGYAGADGPLRRDPAGFATVGDRGRLDGDLLAVDGRPDAVTTGGATVQVSDVERELRAVARGEVVVVALPHGRLGSVVAAVLTDAADHAPLVAASRDRLDPAGRPRLWHLCERLPLTAAGKVDRDALLAMVAGDAPPRRL
jgi:long-chain acyl-CoA synthetase